MGVIFDVDSLIEICWHLSEIGLVDELMLFADVQRLLFFSLADSIDCVAFVEGLIVLLGEVFEPEVVL